LVSGRSCCAGRWWAALGFSLLPGVRAGVGMTHGRVTMLKTDCTMTVMLLDFWTELTGVFFYACCEDKAIQYWFAVQHELSNTKKIDFSLLSVSNNKEICNARMLIMKIANSTWSKKTKGNWLGITRVSPGRCCLLSPPLLQSSARSDISRSCPFSSYTCSRAANGLSSAARSPQNTLRSAPQRQR
jgi:hypothetical protein